MTIEQIEQEKINAVSTVMSTEQGRRFVMDLLDDLCHWGQPVFSPDPVSIGNNVGIQSVGVDLFNKVEEVQPEQSRMMLKERRDRRDMLENDLSKEDAK